MWCALSMAAAASSRPWRAPACPASAAMAGRPTAAQLKQPHSIALDRADNLYICDIQNNRVRRRDAATGIITTFTGKRRSGRHARLAPLTAPLHGPRSIDMRPGRHDVSDPAGGQQSLRHRSGAKDADPHRRHRREGLCAAMAARRGTRPGTDPRASPMRRTAASISPTPKTMSSAESPCATARVVTVAGTGMRGDGPDGDPLTCALARPHGVYVHGGLLYIGDAENHRIRMLEI